MNTEEQVLDEIQSAIRSLPPELEEAVNELAEQIGRQIKCAGEPVGSLALALVGAKAAASN